MIYFLHMVTDSKHDQFMMSVVRAQSHIYNERMKAYFVKADPNQKEDIIVDDDLIIVKGEENLKQGCVYKNLKGIQYIYNTHSDAKYVIKTCITQYFNIKQVEKEFVDLPQNYPCLYGMHEGYMAYGSYMIWNRKAMEIFANSDIKYLTSLSNEQEDLAFTNLSIQLGFDLLPRKHNSSNIYDHYRTTHGFMLQDLKDDWLMVKQKCEQSHIRHIQEKYVILSLLEKYDNEVYNLVDKNFDRKEFCLALIDCLEFLTAIKQYAYFEYTLNLAVNNISFYSQHIKERLIIMVLMTNNNKYYVYLNKIAKSLEKEPSHIRAEIYHLSTWSFQTEIINMDIFKLFFST